MKSDEVDTSGNRTGNGDEVERTADNDGGGGDNGEEATSAGAIGE